MDSEGFPTKGDQQTIKDFSWGDAVWKVFTSQILLIRSVHSTLYFIPLISTINQKPVTSSAKYFTCLMKTSSLMTIQTHSLSKQSKVGLEPLWNPSQ